MCIPKIEEIGKSDYHSSVALSWNRNLYLSMIFCFFVFGWSTIIIKLMYIFI